VKVVDASIVLGWLLDQPSGGSQAVLESHASGQEPLVAPELLNYEVCNALVSRGRLPVALARQAYDYFESLEIETYSLGSPEYDRAIALAAEYRISAYGAAYAVLAQVLGCRLVTADRRLARSLKPLDIIEVAM